MIAEMIVWGFFSALGWMGATWTVEKIYPTEKKEVFECSIKNQEKKSIDHTSGGSCDQSK